MRHRLKRIHRLARQKVFKEGMVNSGDQGFINLIDVGSIGDLPSPWYEHSAQIQFLLKFEPRDRQDTNSNVITIDTALWETEGERDFYIYKGFSESGSSLFLQNYEYVTENFTYLKKQGADYLARTWFERSQLVKTEKIYCRTLDNVLDELQHPYSFHFLKMDVQGAEYQVLKGSEKYLRQNCLGLHLELFTIPLYKEIKLLPEVVEFLANIGFKLVKQCPPHGSFDSQHDCVFIKTDVDNKIVDEIRTIYGL